MLKKHGVEMRIDKYGISLIIIKKNGRRVPLSTTPWPHLNSILFMKGCAYFFFTDERGRHSGLAFYSKQFDTARTNILSHWKIAADGFRPEQLPNHYTKEEEREAIEFINRRFGKIDIIARDKYSLKTKIQIGIIKPANDRPYYTICTLGTGSCAIESHKEKGTSHHALRRAEYMIILPPEWNVTAEEHEKRENSWPIEELNMLAHHSDLGGKALCPYTITTSDSPLAESTTAEGFLFFEEIDWQNGTVEMNLSTGITVGFIQLMAIIKTKNDLCTAGITFDDFLKKAAGIDFRRLSELPAEESMRIMHEKLVAHFRSLTQ